MVSRWLGADEFLNGYERWCLWLGECPPGELRAMPEAMKRVQAVKAFRLASKSRPDAQTRRHPDAVSCREQPSKPYLLIPRVSSERRAVRTDGLYRCKNTYQRYHAHMVTGTTPFHFGVLSSTMHNAWIRYTCGRLESRFPLLQRHRLQQLSLARLPPEFQAKSSL